MGAGLTTGGFQAEQGSTAQRNIVHASHPRSGKGGVDDSVSMNESSDQSQPPDFCRDDRNCTNASVSTDTAIRQVEMAAMVGSI